MTAVELVKNEMKKAIPLSDGRLDLTTIRKTIQHMVGAHPQLAGDGVIDQAINELIKEGHIEERNDLLYYR